MRQIQPPSGAASTLSPGPFPAAISRPWAQDQTCRGRPGKASEPAASWPSGTSPESPTHWPPGPSLQSGLGVVAPFDFALDREIWRWVPDSVSIHLTRTPVLDMAMTLEMAEHIGDPRVVAAATADLLTTAPSVVAYLCSSGSFVGGLAAEQRLRRAMLEAGTPVAVTTSGALLDALATMDIGPLAVATPYLHSVTDRLISFLAEAGHEVVNSACLGLSGRIWTTRYAEVAALVAAADHPEADAVFLSCTNVVSFDVIDPLEQLLGKPVITANQVTIWAALAWAGLRPAAVTGALMGYGLPRENLSVSP